MKRMISLGALICFGICATAQNVNIPDSNLKYLLLHYNPTIDLNADGEISTFEAAWVTNLTLYATSSSPRPVRNVTGIRSFYNLQNLTLFLQADTVDVSGMNKLTYFKVQDDSMHAVNVTGCTKLETLSCNGLLTSLDVSSCSKLRSLDCSGNLLTTLQLGTLDSLRGIACNYNYYLTQVDLSGCKNLTSFDAQYDWSMTHLNASGLSKLTMLNVAFDNALTDVDLSRCSSLDNFNFPMLNQLNHLNVTGCVKMKNISVAGHLQTLDLSSCAALKILNLNSNALQQLNLKNGGWMSNFSFTIPANTSICVDDFERDTLVQYFANLNQQQFLSPYCSIYSGGRYNTIQGTIRLDDNSNGCDANDRGMFCVPVKISDSTGQFVVRYSTPNGNYVHYPYKGLFAVAPYFSYTYFNINPVTSQVTFDTANSLTNTSNFCITPNGVHNDLEIAFLPTWPPARPGFEASYQLIYKNRGTTTLSGQVQLGFDGTKMSYTSASAAPTTQSAGQLNWNYSNLAPFESRTVAVNFLLMPPPVNNSGDTIQYLATINPTANDETPFDNSFILPQRVTGSYDPNDKQCLQGANLDISNISKPLDYLIRFQNLGTDTAFNVVIADTLNTKLDPTSVTITGSSHPCSVRQKNNQLEFVFENIRLPYKAINEPASNGFVAFKVKPKNTVVVGDTLSNRASIYFDFNLPVVTNKANTVIRSGSNPLAVSLEYFSANKQGGVHRLQWKANSNTAMVTFAIERSTDGIRYNNIGNISATTIRLSSPFSFEDAQPLRGRNYYRLKMTDASGATVYSKVALLDNPVAGIQVQAFSATGTTGLLYLTADKTQRLVLKLIGADGRQYFQTSKTINQGNNTISLTLPKLSSGVYSWLLYGADGNLITHKIKL